MEFLKIIAKLDPASRQLVLQAYMGANKGFFMAGYMVGMFADAIMLGVIIHQFFHWWEYARGDDKRVVRFIVYFSMVFSVGVSLYPAIWIFHMFVYGFGNYSVFIEIGWLSWWFLADVIVRVPIQGFFAERAWQMTGRSKLYGAFIAVLYIGAVGTGIALKIILPQVERADLSRTLLLAWISIEIGSDVVVTTTIAYKLCVARTGFTHTDALLTRLLKIVLETQLPPTIMAIMFLIVFLTETVGSGTRAFVCAPKLYVLCLLAVLNSRQSLRRDMSTENSFMKSVVRRDQPGNDHGGVSITTETYTYVTERNHQPPRRSVNRDIELTLDPNANRDRLDRIAEDDGKDDGDLGMELDEVDLNSSKVRLTGER